MKANASAKTIIIRGCSHII